MKEIELHNLSPIPYAMWCKWCIMGRRPNAAHRHVHTKRAIHMLMGNYCFLRDSNDTVMNTVSVGSMPPFNAVTIIPATSRRPADSDAVERLAAIVRSTGVRELVWMSDQDGI